MGYGLLASGAPPACNWSSAPINTPADGSVTTPVTFDTAFGSGTPAVLLTAVDPIADDGWQLDLRAVGITTAGFTLVAKGGPAGSTINVNFGAFGSST